MKRHSIVHVAMKTQKPLLLLSFLASLAANAQPMHCSPGFQDSSCGGVLLNAPQVAPTCSTADGWTTVLPAVWQGSKYSAPTCSYTPPPICGTGMTQVVTPTWNGSAWIGLACTAPPAQIPPPLAASAGNAGMYGYFTTKLSAAGSQTFVINTDGTWAVQRSGFQANSPRSTGSPTSGTWTSDATKAYEYTITQASYGMGSVTPTTTTLTWTTMTNLSFHSGTTGGGIPEGDGKWTINIRQKGTTSPVLTINIELDTANGD